MIRKLVNKDFHLEELLKGSSVALIFKGVGILSGYIFFLIIARLFGAQQLGLFSTCWTILMICSVIGKFGIDTSIVKFIAESVALKQNHYVKIIYRYSLFIIAIISLIISTLLFLLATPISELFLHDPGYAVYIRIISFAIIPFSMMRCNAEALRGMKNITGFSLFENGSVYLVTLLFVLVFYYLGYSQVIFPALLVAIVILFITSFLMTASFLPGNTNSYGTKHENKYSIKKIIRISFPMLLSNSLFLIMSWTDILMLSAFMDKASVGIYNTALKIAALNTIALVAAGTIAAPKFSGLHANSNHQAFKKFIKQTSFFSTLFALPVLIIIIFFPGFLLSFFGEDFTAGAEAMVILAAGFFFSAFSGSCIYILNMTGKEKVARNILLIATIINIVMNYYFIPLFGINGAAISTAASTVFWNILAVLFIYRYQGFFTYPVNFR